MHLRDALQCPNLPSGYAAPAKPVYQEHKFDLSPFGCRAGTHSSAATDSFRFIANESRRLNIYNKLLRVSIFISLTYFH